MAFGHENLRHDSEKPGYTGSYRRGENVSIGDELFNDLDCKRGLVRERPVHRRVQELAINGYTNNEIAATVGLTPSTVSNVLRQPWAREHMVDRMAETANEEIKSLLEAAAPSAVKRIIELASDPRIEGTKLVLDANNAILDRFLGKPVQPMTQEVKEFDKLSTEELEKIAAGQPV